MGSVWWQRLVAASRDHGLLSGLPPGGVQHRTDYPAVSTAAAQIAVESFSHLLVGRGWVVPQEPAAAGQPFHGGDRGVHG
jgi:hypothetical protein